MALEIERKFLVVNDTYKSLATSSHPIAQYYLSNDPERTVRVRIIDNRAYITIKGITCGATRHEWEYEIPVEDAREMIELCTSNGISKIRWLVPYRGRTWEIDEFEGRHSGLVLAEIEIEDAGASVELPDFIGKEVTGCQEYYNSVLAGIDR